MRILTVVAAGHLALLAGCCERPSKLATVSGRVTFAGAPLPGGRLSVRTVAPDAQVQKTFIDFDPDGAYILTQAPVGPAQVAVDTEVVKTELIPTQQGGGGPVTFRHVPIPKKYASFETSGLTIEIGQGEQTRDIVLQP